MFKKNILLALLVLTFSGVTFAQYSAGDMPSTKDIITAWKQEIFEYGKHKYALEVAENGRRIEFPNKSNLTITAYQFGCVKRKKLLLMVFSKELLINETIEPGEVHFWSSNHGFFPKDECKKGKLAIIEVYFSNNEIWKLD